MTIPAILAVAFALLLGGCENGMKPLNPHPETTVERKDFYQCLDVQGKTYKDAYICHVAVELREQARQNEIPVKEFTK
jgi:hypothetical protein